MKKFLLCDMYPPLRGYALQFFVRKIDSYSREYYTERERERESHFRTVIASNNNVLIIIYSYARRSIICPFRLSFNTFANANSITARFEK